MSLACSIYLDVYVELLLAVAARSMLHMTFMYRRIATQQRRPQDWALAWTTIRTRSDLHNFMGLLRHNRYNQNIVGDTALHNVTLQAPTL
jgi:hypothetical protein